MSDSKGHGSCMEKVSLIVHVRAGDDGWKSRIEEYRAELRSSMDQVAIETILIGEAEALNGVVPTGFKAASGNDPVSALQSGVDSATGDPVVVVDPSRRYEPGSLTKLLRPLRDRNAELAIAVPQGDLGGGGSHHNGRSLAFLSRAVLGTSDAFSGLAALRGREAHRVRAGRRAKGSRLVLHLLSCDFERRDVPVSSAPVPFRALLPLRLDDFRQLKRVVDHRFGNFSRLIQFCLVGASGMVIDLTLYALLQLLFQRFWALPAPGQTTGFSASLAVAGLLSILAALCWNFTLNRRLTFNDAGRGSLLRQFTTYALGNALGIVVSLFLRLYLPGHFEFFAQHRLAAAVVGIVVATGISFSTSRWLVFIRNPDPQQTPSLPHIPVEVPVRGTPAVR